MSFIKRPGWYGDRPRHRITSKGIRSKRVYKKPFAYYRVVSKKPVKQKGNYRIFYESRRHGTLYEDTVKDREDAMKFIALNKDSARWAYNRKNKEYIYLDGRTSSRKGAPVIKTRVYHKTPRDIKRAFKEAK